MTKRSKIAITLLIVISIIAILGSFSIRGPIKGQIVDSVTKEPIPGIQVDRVIKTVIASLGDSLDGSSKKYSTKTNENGEFNFSFKIINKAFLLGSVSQDQIKVNKSGFDSINSKYYPLTREGLFPGYGGAEMIEVGLSESNKIELVPVVDSIEECQENIRCLGENYFNLALKLGKEQMCVELDEYSKYIENGGISDRLECIKMFAIARGDLSLCGLAGNEMEQGSCKFTVERYLYPNADLLNFSKEGYKKRFCRESGWTATRLDSCNKLMESEKGSINKLLVDQVLEDPGSSFFSGSNQSEYGIVNLDGYEKVTVIGTDNENIIYARKYWGDKYDLRYYVYNTQDNLNVYKTTEALMRSHKSAFGKDFEKVEVCGDTEGDIAFSNLSQDNIIGELVFKVGPTFHSIRMIVKYGEEKIEIESVSDSDREKFKKDAIRLGELHCNPK